MYVPRPGRKIHPLPLLLAFPRKFKLQQGTTIRRNFRSETLLEIEGCTRPFPDSFQRALNPLPRGNGRAPGFPEKEEEVGERRGYRVGRQ